MNQTLLDDNTTNPLQIGLIILNQSTLEFYNNIALDVFPFLSQKNMTEQSQRICQNGLQSESEKEWKERLEEEMPESKGVIVRGDGIYLYKIDTQGEKTLYMIEKKNQYPDREEMDQVFRSIREQLQVIDNVVECIHNNIDTEKNKAIYNRAFLRLKLIDRNRSLLDEVYQVKLEKIDLVTVVSQLVAEVNDVECPNFWLDLESKHIQAFSTANAISVRTVILMFLTMALGPRQIKIDKTEQHVKVDIRHEGEKCEDSAFIYRTAQKILKSMGCSLITYQEKGKGEGAEIGTHYTLLFPVWKHQLSISTPVIQEAEQTFGLCPVHALDLGYHDVLLELCWILPNMYYTDEDLEIM